MNREIKFRGRRVGIDEWVYGYLICSSDRAWIAVNYYYIHYEVDPATVGQFTGIKDKNLREIYEGDIMIVRQRTIGKGKNTKYKNFFIPVEFYNGEFMLPFENYDEYRFRDGEMNHFEVVGNIHDNPELLKNEQS